MNSAEEKILGDFQTDMKVGDILRKARLEKKITIPELAENIKVSIAHIEAIEDGKFETIPARVYLMGFIRAYADYVDLDSEKIIGLLKRQAGERIAPKENFAIQNNVMEDKSLPDFKIYMGLAIVLVIALSVFSAIKENHYFSADIIPTVPNDLKSQTTLLSKPEKKQVDSSVTVDMSVLDDLPKATGQIVLKAIENVWVDIRDGEGKTAFSRVLSAGEEYWIPADRADFVMTVGNAGGLQMLLDEKPLPALGKKGQVIRKLSLAPDKLRERLK